MANESPLAPLFAPDAPDPSVRSRTFHDVLRDSRLDDDRVLGNVDPRNEGGDTVLKDGQGTLETDTQTGMGAADGGNGGDASEFAGMIQVDPDFANPRVFKFAETQPFAFDYAKSLTLRDVDWIIVDNQTSRQFTKLANPGFAQIDFTTDSSKWRGNYLLQQNIERPLPAEDFRKRMHLVVHFQLETQGQEVLSPGTKKSTGSIASSAFTVLSREATQDQVNEAEGLLRAQADKDNSLYGGLTTKGSIWNPNRSEFDSGQSGNSATGSVPSGTSSSDASDSRDKRPSLSNGAKAGIGVACAIVGLLLIGLAIFFFLRNRRRRAASASASVPVGAAGSVQPVPYVTTSVNAPPNDYLRDKEAQTNLADSPQSEDVPGRSLRDSSVIYPDPVASHPAPAAAAAAASPAVGVAAAPTPGAASLTDRSLSPSEARTRPEVPAAVAHLVEEGMTEAEIRRLEEEERALDRAIEQAAQRR